MIGGYVLLFYTDSYEKFYAKTLTISALRLISNERDVPVVITYDSFDVFDVDPSHPEWGNISTNAAFKYYKELKFSSPKQLSEELASKINELVEWLMKLSVWKEPDGTVVFAIKKG